MVVLGLIRVLLPFVKNLTYTMVIGGAGQLKLGGKVEPEDMHVIAGDKIGITVNFERGTSYINGKPEKVNIRATNLCHLPSDLT